MMILLVVMQAIGVMILLAIQWKHGTQAEAMQASCPSFVFSNFK